MEEGRYVDGARRSGGLGLDNKGRSVIEIWRLKGLVGVGGVERSSEEEKEEVAVASRYVRTRAESS